MCAKKENFEGSLSGKVLRRGSNGRLLSGKGHEGTFWDNGNILCLDCSGIYIGIKISQNELNCNQKSMHFIRCKVPQLKKKFNAILFSS